MKKFRKMPSVGSVMTPFPFYSNAADSVEKVERLMRRHKIRHVPVMRDGEIVGLVSERDLHRWAAVASEGTLAAPMQAGEVMIPDPYVVPFDTPLSEVAFEMERRRIGSALVIRQGKLAGILSATDLCRILAQILEAEFPLKGGNDAA